MDSEITITLTQSQLATLADVLIKLPQIARLMLFAMWAAAPEDVQNAVIERYGVQDEDETIAAIERYLEEI